MKELISLNGDGNSVRFETGNDGDICITFSIPSRNVFWECVRVGSTHSGGQVVPTYVKKALNDVCIAMDKWNNETEN